MSLIATVLWPGMKALSPSSQLGGILARKRGYHNSRDHLPKDDYSVGQFAVDREGPADEAAAIDWTFPTAHSRDYAEISKFSKRLYAARLDADDTRTKYIREFFGQIDSDRTVEGWDFAKNRASTSDTSHLWHIHLSIHRKYVNDPQAMKAILSILKGQSLEEFKADNSRAVTFEHFRSHLPILKQGDSDDNLGGTAYITRAQKQLNVTADGEYGPQTAAAVKARGFSSGSTIDNAVWENLFAMWGATVVDTYTYTEKRTITQEVFTAKLPILKYGDKDSVDGTGTAYVKRLQKALNVDVDGDYGPLTRAGVTRILAGDGKTVDLEVWSRLYALWGYEIIGTTMSKAAKK